MPVPGQPPAKNCVRNIVVAGFPWQPRHHLAPADANRPRRRGGISISAHLRRRLAGRQHAPNPTRTFTEGGPLGSRSRASRPDRRNGRQASRGGSLERDNERGHRSSSRVAAPSRTDEAPIAGTSAGSSSSRGRTNIGGAASSIAKACLLPSITPMSAHSSTRCRATDGIVLHGLLIQEDASPWQGHSTVAPELQAFQRRRPCRLHPLGKRRRYSALDALRRAASRP